nr:odorant binding protein 46 [Monochamus saltuarius]
MILPTYIVILVATILATQVNADIKDHLQSRMDLPEVQKCIKSTGFTPGPPSEEFSPDQLCFFKCIMEEKGMLNSNGEVSPTAVDNPVVPIPEDKKEDIKQCMATAGKIESCEDMAKLFACVPM